jgi:hypothetical protein
MSRPPCGGCAAAARRRSNGVVTKYVWQSDDGFESIEYDSEIQAKAKVSRKGGTYTPRDLPPST